MIKSPHTVQSHVAQWQCPAMASQTAVAAARTVGFHLQKWRQQCRRRHDEGKDSSDGTCNSNRAADTITNPAAAAAVAMMAVAFGSDAGAGAGSGAGGTRPTSILNPSSTSGGCGGREGRGDGGGGSGGDSSVQ